LRASISRIALSVQQRERLRTGDLGPVVQRNEAAG
jgi:hypothetical protein